MHMALSIERSVVAADAVSLVSEQLLMIRAKLLLCPI